MSGSNLICVASVVPIAISDRMRSRSRSTDAVRRYIKVRAERRGGKSWKRRFRSSCIKVLQVFIDLLQQLLRQDIPSDTREVTQDRFDTAVYNLRCITNDWWQPKRGETLVERYQGDVPIDSPIAESIAVTVSESEAEEEEEVDRQAAPSALASASSSLAGVRVTRANPLLRAPANTSATAVPTSTPIVVASSSRRSLPEVVASRVLSVQGIDCAPKFSQVKICDKTIISVDWHQVLDVVRSSQETIRPDTNDNDGYHILRCIEASIQALKARVPNTFFVITSFCHNEFFRRRVLSIQGHPSNHHCFQLAVVTREKVGKGGKYEALQGLFDFQSCRIYHIDDNESVLNECSRNGIETIGVVVPRRKGRASGVRYAKNVCQALGQIGQ